nr:hypothetical protein [Nostoc sp. ChiQUE02]
MLVNYGGQGFRGVRRSGKSNKNSCSKVAWSNIWRFKADKKGAALYEAMSKYVAVRILQLILGRDNLDLPATVAFSHEQQQCLSTLAPTLEGRTQRWKKKQRNKQLTIKRKFL